jgi:hypothetical protein
MHAASQLPMPPLLLLLLPLLLLLHSKLLAPSMK